MSNLTDGWGEDDDLNFDDSDNGGLEGGDDGWGDDDDLNFDDEPVSAAAPCPPPPPPPPPPRPQHNVPFGSEKNLEADGWGDDDDLDLDFDDTPAPAAGRTVPESPDNSFGSPPDNTFGESTARAPPTSLTSATIPPSRSAQEDGWGDDDLNLGDDEDPANFGSAPGALQNHDRYVVNAGFGASSAPDEPEEEINFSAESNDVNETSGSGWEDDDELFGDDPEEVAAASVQQDRQIAGAVELPSSQDIKLQEIQKQLENYVNSLERIVWSINAVLEFEYNTPEKAQELVDYYSSRKQLAEYTRKKELPRMEYQVVLPYGHVETDKEEIEAQYLPDESLLARCANQSLLADLLHQITGPDLIVRPAFLAVCVAHWCKFTIHFEGNLGGEDMVDCACRMHLSLPTADGERLNIAEVTVQVVFKPNEPIVEYRVLSVDVLLKDMAKLSSTANFLNMIEGHFDEFPGHEDIQLHNAPADKYRDAFLENSQKLLSQSTLGMKSALQQMESVVNLRQKLNLVKGGYKTISKFIPDTDQMLAAEEEARQLVEAREQQQKMQRNTRPAPPPPQHRPPPEAHNRHQQPPPPPPRPSEASRPTSILGGIVSSGWSALAKSMAIPDDDPALYGAPTTEVEDRPKLYRTEPEPPRRTPPTLYNRQDLPPPNFPTGPKQTKEQPKAQMKPPAENLPRIYNRQESSTLPHSRPERTKQEKLKPQAAKTREQVPPPRPPPPPQQQEKGTGSIQAPHHLEEHQTKKSFEKDTLPAGRVNATSGAPSVAPISSPETTDTSLNTNSFSQKDSLVPQDNKAFSKQEEPPLQPKSKPGAKVGDLPTKKRDESTKAGDKPLHRGEEDHTQNFGANVAFGANKTGHELNVPTQPTEVNRNFSGILADEDRPQNRPKPIIADVEYNSDDDIIETCTRWSNPRPHRPYITI